MGKIGGSVASTGVCGVAGPKVDVVPCMELPWGVLCVLSNVTQTKVVACFAKFVKGLADRLWGLGSRSVVLRCGIGLDIVLGCT